MILLGELAVGTRTVYTRLDHVAAINRGLVAEQDGGH